MPIRFVVAAALLMIAGCASGSGSNARDVASTGDAAEPLPAASGDVDLGDCSPLTPGAPTGRFHAAVVGSIEPADQIGTPYVAAGHAGHVAVAVVLDDTGDPVGTAAWLDDEIDVWALDDRAATMTGLELADTDATAAVAELVAQAQNCALATVDAPAADLASPKAQEDDPDPAMRAGAASRYLVCNGPIHQGGSRLDVEGPDPAADPLLALEEFDFQDVVELPEGGWRTATTTGDRVLYSYEVDGEAKAAVIVADASVVHGKLAATEGWVVETFATCDPAEYAPEDVDPAPDVWTDVDGQPLPATVVTSFPGSAHCEWELVTFISLNDEHALYARDPEGILPESDMAVAYDGDVELPSDAVDTGYRRGGDELWLSEDETIAYVVTPDAVEAWPATETGCA